MSLDIANVTRVGLDDVLYDEFDKETRPDELTPDDTTFFNQMSVDSDAFIFEEFGGVSEFEEHATGQTRILESIRTGNKKTIDVLNWKKTIPIEKEKFDDAKFNLISEIVSDMGRKGRQAQYHNAVKKTYADAFDGNEFTCPDGVALASNSHTNLNGDTIDNLDTSALTPDGLKTNVKALRLQKDQRGELGGQDFAGLLTPNILYDEALEIMKSDKEANSAENNLNFFNTIYGRVAIKTSSYLDSDFNSATNADTSYHLVSGNHKIKRAVRSGMITDLVPWTVDDEDRYKYKASYREICFPGGWVGLQASNGTV